MGKRRVAAAENGIVEQGQFSLTVSLERWAKVGVRDFQRASCVKNRYLRPV